MILIHEVQLRPEWTRGAGVELVEIAIGVSVLSAIAPLVLEPDLHVVRAGHVGDRASVTPRVRVVLVFVRGRRVAQAQPRIVAIDDTVPTVAVGLRERGR